MMDPCVLAIQEPGETAVEPEEDRNKEEQESMTATSRTQSGRANDLMSSHATTILRQSQIHRYMTSPSARQKQIKQKDCRFCEAYLPPSCLIEHLKKETHKSCRILYLKIYRVSCLQSLVSKLFSCEMCFEQKRINFQTHLEKNKQCLMKFQLKFGLEDIKKIDAKVKAVKRRTFPSRSSVVLKSKYETMRDSKSLSASLNEYRENVALGNFKLCIQCHSNYREFGAKEVKQDDELFERFNLDSQENKILRRFETFFICNSCLKLEECIEDDEEANSSLGVFAKNDDVTFFPPRDEINDPCMAVSQKNVKLWFPNTFEAVEHLETTKLQKNKCLVNLYKTQAVENSTISDLYKLECQKYQKRMEAELLFCGIINHQTNTVDNLRRISTCAKISCSKDWYAANASRMKERQEQFGSIHATLKIDLENESPDVIATALLQLDVPVTLEKKGLANGELEITYMLHHDHESDTNCSTDCKVKSNIEDYVNDSGFRIEDAFNSFTGTYVSSCHQKLVSFAKSILQAPGSGLYSHDYQLHLSFDKDGMASIVGSFWPDALNSINDNIAKNEGDIVDEEELLQFVDQNICCTGNPTLLLSKFGLSENESMNLSELVLAKQFHNECEEVEECEICSCLPLPSMESLLKHKCCEDNYTASTELLNLIRRNLKLLTVEEKKGTRTLTFFEELWIRVGAKVRLNDEVLTFEIANEDIEIKFEIDCLLKKYLEKYEDSIRVGVYQYALSCCGDVTGDFIVMQRLWLIDCHIIPFNPLHLKANKTTSSIKIVNDTNLFKKNFLPKIEVEEHDERMDPRVPLSHHLISLAEAIAITDPQIKMVESSSKEQFVNAKENRGVMLKKVKNQEEDVYEGAGSADKYKLLADPISRHFNRQNTSDGLLLSETSAWYDYAGEEKSRELRDTFKNGEIPISDEPSVCSKTNLPEYILCTNGDVLLKRKKRKVIIVPIPKTERDFKYSKSLLFLPIRSESELNGTGCEDRFKEVDGDQGALIVELNERKMFPKRILKMTRVDQLDELLDALSEISDEENMDE